MVGRHEVADRQVWEDGAAAVRHFDPRPDMREIGFRPAWVKDNVAAEIVRGMSFPRVNDLAGLEIDGVQLAGIELGDVKPALIRAQGNAPNERADRQMSRNPLCC